MLKRLQGLLPDYDTKAITEEMAGQVIPLYESNRDFIMLSEDAPATLESCLEDIRQTPPGLDSSHKSFIGFFKNETAVAALDLITGYPDDSACWIGLLLVHRDMQKSGIGREIAAAVVAAARACGFSSVRLGVIDKNEKALAFWSKSGFYRTGEKLMKRENKDDLKIILMTKDI